MTSTFDLRTMGRSSIDLYAKDVGAAFVDINSFADCRLKNKNNLVIFWRVELQITRQLCTKLEFRNYYRQGFRAYAPVDYHYHFEQGNGGILADQNVSSVFAKQRGSVQFRGLCG